MQLRGRVSAGPNVKLLRFNDPLFAGWTPELKFVLAQGEMQGLFRARGEIDSLKALQLPHRPRCTTCPLMTGAITWRAPIP